MKLEVKKIENKIELDTSMEKCTACMHCTFPGYSKEARLAGITGCELVIKYDRQYMIFG